MKVKTATLDGTALNWAVAIALGHIVYKDALLDGAVMRGFWIQGYHPADLNKWHSLSLFKPSTDWSYGGLIIEREEIFPIPNISKDKNFPGFDFLAKRNHYDPMDPPLYGPTPLIAAMRCFVALKLGNNVAVPEELLPLKTQ